MTSTFKTKLLIMFISSIFFLGLLEISLRTAGYFLVANHEREKAFVCAGGKTILCVGDSYTNGGLVDRDTESYPALLEERLRKEMPRARFCVINKGLCESNTHELYRELPRWIDYYRPDTIILLSGSANLFNPWYYDYYRKKTFFSYLKKQFFDLRVIKMVTIMRLNLKERRATGGNSIPKTIIAASDPSRQKESRMIRYCSLLDQRFGKYNTPKPEDPVHMLWYYDITNQRDIAIEYGLAQLEHGNADRMEVIRALAEHYLASGRVENLGELLIKAHAEFPDSQRMLDCLAYYFRHVADWHRHKSDYGNAIKFYLKAVKVDPLESYNYYWMSKLFDMQSYYDSGTVYNELSRIRKDNPEAAGSDALSKYLEIYRDKRKWEQGVEGWIASDLELIANLAQKKGARLIIQNYPIPYAMANRRLKETADSHSLPFVDNLSVFDRLEDPEIYFFDDDHCTIEGHRLMVDNIYKVMVENRIITDERETR